MPESVYGLMPPGLAPEEGLADDSAALGRDGPSTRRCGRCLAQFPGDPDADPVVIPEFWMCPACRETLLGKVAGAGGAVATRPR